MVHDDTHWESIREFPWYWPFEIVGISDILSGHILSEGHP